VITKLKGYEAEAEILGEIHDVSFSGNCLTVFALDLTTAHAILKRLSDGGVAAVKLPEAKAAEPLPDAPKEETCHKAAPPAPKPVVEDAMVLTPGVDPQSMTGAISASPPAPPAPEPPPAPLAPSEKAPTPKGDGVPEAIVRAARLREVVDYLRDHEGWQNADAVLVGIAKYRDHSPVIQRAADVEARVRKMMA